MFTTGIENVNCFFIIFTTIEIWFGRDRIRSFYQKWLLIVLLGRITIIPSAKNSIVIHVLRQTNLSPKNTRILVLRCSRAIYAIHARSPRTRRYVIAFEWVFDGPTICARTFTLLKNEWWKYEYLTAITAVLNISTTKQYHTDTSRFLTTYRYFWNINFI